MTADLNLAGISSHGTQLMPYSPPLLGLDHTHDLNAQRRCPASHWLGRTQIVRVSTLRRGAIYTRIPERCGLRPYQRTAPTRSQRDLEFFPSDAVTEVPGTEEKGGFGEWRVVHRDQPVMSSIEYRSEMKGRFSALINATKSLDRN